MLPTVAVAASSNAYEYSLEFNGIIRRGVAAPSAPSVLVLDLNGIL
jgi:hypothetical protein